MIYGRGIYTNACLSRASRFTVELRTNCFGSAAHEAGNVLDPWLPTGTSAEDMQEVSTIVAIVNSQLSAFLLAALG